MYGVRAVHVRAISYFACLILGKIFAPSSVCCVSIRVRIQIYNDKPAVRAVQGTPGKETYPADAATSPHKTREITMHPVCGVLLDGSSAPQA